MGLPKRTIRALALNGGGIRILIQIESLIALEEETGKRCKDYFDYMGGTSGGGIVVALLSQGYTAIEAKDIILKEYKNIFKKRWFLSAGLFFSKYGGKNVKEAMGRYLSDVSMKDLDCKIIIPTINSDLYTVNFFKTGHDKMLLDGVIASAAAPIHFPKYKMGKYWHEDGGMAYNNPSEILRNQIFDDYYEGIPYNMLNVTTGSRPRKKISKFRAVGGLFINVIQTVNVLLHMQDLRTHSSMYFKHRIKGVDTDPLFVHNDSGLYCRVESIIKESSGKIDDTSDKNIRAMCIDGRKTVNIFKPSIKEFVKQSKK